jgi:hypothetical protein
VLKSCKLVLYNAYKIFVEIDSADKEFAWHRSLSKDVKHYKFKIRRDEEKSTDYIVPDQEGN